MKTIIKKLIGLLHVAIVGVVLLGVIPVIALLFSPLAGALASFLFIAVFLFLSTQGDNYTPYENIPDILYAVGLTTFHLVLIISVVKLLK
jgi:hypothetical protein